MFQKPSSDNLGALSGFSSTNVDSDNVETVVGPSMNVEGDFSSEGNIIIKGAVSGSVHTSQNVLVEQSARVNASVKAGTGTISGHVKGHIRVDDKLEVTSSAQIRGDIHCKTLVVEAGALISGKITMPGIEVDVPDSRNEKKRSSARSKVKTEEYETATSTEE